MKRPGFRSDHRRRLWSHTHTAYVVETMMDELAEAAGVEPVEFRLRYLTDPRAHAVLELAADRAGAVPEGLTRGIAVHKSFGSYVAEVADVRMREDGTVKVARVTCAVDCGVPVNPSNIRAQIEGGLGYGLSAILREEITLSAQGWLRLPAGHALMAEAEGARVWIKDAPLQHGDVLPLPGAA